MFKDRKDAASKLALALQAYRGKHVLVLGIPRGGAETAYYVAKHLGADFSLAISRKLGYPTNPEAAFGAVAEDGSVYLSDVAKQRLLDDEIDKALAKEKQEIERRVQVFRRGKPLPDMTGRTVIIVDDGIATGATLLATIQLCKNKKAGKIVVAAPVSELAIATDLKKIVDDVVILKVLTNFTSVSEFYRDFRNLTDQQTLSFVDRWEKEHPVVAKM